METPEEKNEANLPENVELKSPIGDIVIPASQINHDPDQHTSPLKEVLIDDSKKPELSLEFTEGVLLEKVNFILIENDLYVFEDSRRIYKVKKHASITKALEKISFACDVSINICCIGDDKFKITKN